MAAIIDIISRNPPAAIGLAFIALMLEIAVLIDPRRRRLLFAVLILLPISPLLVLRMLAAGIVALCDLTVSGLWAAPWAYAARIIERDFLHDDAILDSRPETPGPRLVSDRDTARH